MKRMFSEKVLADAIRYKKNGRHEYPEQFLEDVLKIGPICEVVDTVDENQFRTLYKVDGTDFFVPSNILKEKVGVDMK